MAEQSIKQDENASIEDVEISNITPTIINNQLNDIFTQRLGHLDVNAPNDKQLKLFIYQEWIDTLHRSTQAAINYKETIEKEVLQKLSPYHCRLLIDAEKFEIEYQKCRSDIEKLIQFIQGAFHHNDWDMTGIKLETTQKLRKLSKKKFIPEDKD